VAASTNDTIRVTIITPERKLMSGTDVKSVTLTGSEGMIQVLPGHVPMIGTLHAGVFSYETPAGEIGSGVISSGFFQVLDNNVSVMAETLELPEEIDVGRAKAAQQKAEAALKEAGMDERAFRKYQLKLMRSLIRQQVGGRRSG
jgi:F-type H+-transporting ATPase subunit epsilon